VLAERFSGWVVPACTQQWYYNSCHAMASITLDAVVLDAFGFSAKKDLLVQLLALNLENAS